jgi:urease accessory protein UreF
MIGASDPDRWNGGLPWAWCLAFTATLPREARQRRRDEMRSHLWESREAGLATRSVGWASLRGAADDVLWAISQWARAIGRQLKTPTPYVVAAVILVVQAAFAWNAAASWLEHDVQGGSLLAAMALLVVAASVAAVRRRRRP